MMSSKILDWFQNMFMYSIFKPQTYIFIYIYKICGDGMARSFGVGEVTLKKLIVKYHRMISKHQTTTPSSAQNPFATAVNPQWSAFFEP